MLYENGLKEQYTYNDLGQVTEVYQTKNNGTRTLAYSYLYTDDGALVSFENHLTKEITVFRYDAGGRVIYSATAEADAYEQYTSYGYNEYGDLSSLEHTVSAFANSVFTHGYSYSYTSDRKLARIDLSSDVTNAAVTYTYDALNRLTNKTLTAGSSFTQSTNYTYRSFINSDDLYTYTGLLVSAYENKVNGTTTERYSYMYDGNGNVTSITYADYTYVNYQYDDRGQLTREYNTRLGKTYAYTYDNAGNRTKMVVTNHSTGASTTTTYGYASSGWVSERKIIEDYFSRSEVPKARSEPSRRLAKATERDYATGRARIS